jgi:hypothetical protein
VKQLEQSLESGKLNERRTSEVRRSLKVLRSPDTPLIKLRQIMHSSFGDYRAKMAAEEKSTAARLDESRVKIGPGAPPQGSAGAPSTRMTFIKKAASKTADTDKSGGESDAAKSEFKFAFSIPGERF